MSELTPTNSDEEMITEGTSQADGDALGNEQSHPDNLSASTEEGGDNCQSHVDNENFEHPSDNNQPSDVGVIDKNNSTGLSGEIMERRERPEGMFRTILNKLREQVAESAKKMARLERDNEMLADVCEEACQVILKQRAEIYRLIFENDKLTKYQEDLRDKINDLTYESQRSAKTISWLRRKGAKNGVEQIVSQVTDKHAEREKVAKERARAAKEREKAAEERAEIAEMCAEELAYKLEKAERERDKFREALRLLKAKYKEELGIYLQEDGLTGLITGTIWRNNEQVIINKLKEKNLFPLSYVMLGLDFFKKVNDTYGHGGGDEVLKVFGKILRDSIRPQDIAIRWGGEEILIILTECSKDTAVPLIERIRERMADQKFDHIDEKLKVTMSGGISERSISEADLALYDAKNGGRNRIAVHRTEDSTIKTPTSQS